MSQKGCRLVISAVSMYKYANTTINPADCPARNMLCQNCKVEPILKFGPNIPFLINPITTKACNCE